MIAKAIFPRCLKNIIKCFLGKIREDIAQKRIYPLYSIMSPIGCFLFGVDTLLCTLDHILDNISVLKLHGKSFRGMELKTVYLQTGKIPAVQTVVTKE